MTIDTKTSAYLAMTKAARIGIAASLLAVCGLAPPSAQAADDHVVVSNLRYGVVCGPDDGQRVCFQTSDIQISGEGRCIYNRQPIACTWYGYSFDYTLPAAEAVLDCTWSSDVAGDEGNPDGIRQHNATSGVYQITLKSDDSHFFNPQYSSFQERPDAGPEEALQACSYKGEKLFEIPFHLHFPEH